MKRTLFAVLTLALLMSMALPAFAAGRAGSGTTGGAGTGAGTGVCTNPVGDQVPDRVQDRLQDGTCVQVPATAAGAQSQSQVRSQVASMQPEPAGNPTPTATAQRVLAQNAECIATQTNIPADISAKLTNLFNTIIERFRVMFGLA